ncbi:hypothetical protein OAP63_05490 [Vibrio sp.]|uniref:Uncharacterized protein n=1 Tax=Vibrio viridaestus TaxID=2487322 RepID=A0A3N9TDQ2_9VIBR|nr:hypothetical protein [Vibrio viridaestus]MDC0610166.1 hypothetical protein [Vibrio sp.]RQW62200.1 hypothetical protein EES38_15910 [Vibrio viridaestus]
MMYADLVDMNDFTSAIAELGVVCDSTESDNVKRSIETWLGKAAPSESKQFWATVSRIEEDGILLPEVESLIYWSHELEAVGQ